MTEIITTASGIEIPLTELESLSESELTEFALEEFHHSFSHGGTGLSFDERNLLAEIKLYMRKPALIQFILEGSKVVEVNSDK